MGTVMIIEDDQVVREELTLVLENGGYRAIAISEFRNLPEQVRDRHPDLVLLDLSLPEVDGLSLCASIRKWAPLIIVTGRSSVLDELQALNLGSDDYITKPYRIPVLLARVQAVLRRCGKSRRGPEELEGAGLRLNLLRGSVSANGKSENLTRNEQTLLACLLSRPGEIVSREDLMDALWDSRAFVDDNTLTVTMTRLRGKLERLGLSDRIRTRRGMGYQL